VGEGREAGQDPGQGHAAAAAAFGVSRSLSGRRWVWRLAEDRLGAAIAQRLGLPDLLGRLLAARGLDADAAAHFLTPTLRALLPDPSCLVDMDAAASRLADAARRCERVAVFGDYDVDGACAGALVTGVLGELGCAVEAYVPDRMTEGYGPNAPALLGLADRGATLIVCVDCGTAAAEALAAVRGRADVVVLDHHTADGAPPVLATVNPNRPDDRSGLGGLCAAAVGFLAMVATVRTLRRSGWFAGRAEPDLLRCLDLVALATVCDVMPLSGLNRALVTQGLRVLARRERPGLAALLDVAAVRDTPGAMALGFALGPRINASGRLGQADLGLRLLLCQDPEEARVMAEALDAVNRQRQTVEASILEAAVREGEAQVAAGRAVLLVAGEGWHAGVVGIIAGRLRERFNRPACVAGLSDGVARGSGRSVPGHDLGAAVIAARQAGLLGTGGGHAMAAGFSVAAASAAALGGLHGFLDDRLAAAARLPAAPDLAVEGAVQVAGCGLDLAHQLGRLAPFGAGNEEPMLVIPRARVARAERVGKDGATLSLRLADEAGQGGLKAVLFRAGEGPLALALLAGDRPLHIAGHLRVDSWNGRARAGFVVADAALAT
jgi:single-stranded-DNA-specific exonuclease